MIAREVCKILTHEQLQALEHYISTDEAARFLGISKQTLYKKLDLIPHVKRGKRLFFKRSSLKQYIEQ